MRISEKLEKRALNVRLHSPAVLRCCSREGERWKAKVKVERVEAEDKMSKFKCQGADK